MTTRRNATIVGVVIALAVGLGVIAAVTASDTDGPSLGEVKVLQPPGSVCDAVRLLTFEQAVTSIAQLPPSTQRDAAAVRLGALRAQAGDNETPASMRPGLEQLERELDAALTSGDFRSAERTARSLDEQAAAHCD